MVRLIPSLLAMATVPGGVYRLLGPPSARRVSEVAPRSQNSCSRRSMPTAGTAYRGQTRARSPSLTSQHRRQERHRLRHELPHAAKHSLVLQTPARSAAAEPMYLQARRGGERAVVPAGKPPTNALCANESFPFERRNHQVGRCVVTTRAGWRVRTRATRTSAALL